MRAELLGGALVLLNVGAFAAFAQDKLRARWGRVRTPTPWLLAWAVLGPVGASLGRTVWRHKTRQWRFSVAILLGLVLMAVALAPQSQGALL